MSATNSSEETPWIIVCLKLFVTMLELSTKPSVLLYHTEVRWLSRDQVLTRVFELRKQIEMFLSLVVHFESEDFILFLAYLSDIFTHLNDSNIFIQVKGKKWSLAEKRYPPLLANFQCGKIASIVKTTQIFWTWWSFHFYRIIARTYCNLN